MKRKLELVITDNEFTILINTLIEYRNNQISKGNIVDYLDKILFKLKKRYA